MARTCTCESCYMGPNMWLIQRVSEEMLVDQNSEFVLCLVSEYRTKSAPQHHSGGAILHKTRYRVQDDLTGIWLTQHMNKSFGHHPKKTELGPMKILVLVCGALTR